MAIRLNPPIQLFQFEIFSHENLIHGIFTRHGGVSPAPWKSLNLGGTVGDSRENVVTNRERIFIHLEREAASIFDVWQVHGDEVVISEIPRSLDEPQQKADAIITQNPSVTLVMRFADCVPILFYEPVKKVVAIAHAGWQGTVKRIARKTVESICRHYGSHAGDILAGIGPSIGPDHYEIQSDVADIVVKNLKGIENRVIFNKSGKIHFDLWKANELILNEAGVHKVEISNICTACKVEDWYSHRAEHGKTGRFGAILAIKKN